MDKGLSIIHKRLKSIVYKHLVMLRQQVSEYLGSKVKYFTKYKLIEKVRKTNYYSARAWGATY